MDHRYSRITVLSAAQHGAVSLSQLERAGVDKQLRSAWAAAGLITRLGPRSYAIVGSEASWHRSAWAAAADVAGAGFVAGRSGARLHGLDGFGLVSAKTVDPVEVLVSRSHRGVRTPHVVGSTSILLGRADSIEIDGVRCLKAERLILDSPLFGFSREETENAIDSAIRLRLVNEQRLRTAVIIRHRRGINGGRGLLDALVDSGGESRLERWFLALVRDAGLGRPELQLIWRDGARTIARVDAYFDGGLVVEIAGHGTHSSRRQRQVDEQRRTELVLRGIRVITFTYDDVRDRPAWVIARLREAVALSNAS